MLRVYGKVPPELWNKLGLKLIPKLRSSNAVTLQVRLEFQVSSQDRQRMLSEMRRSLNELGLEDWILEEDISK